MQRVGSPNWRKSSRSGDGNCVEVAFDGEAILVRDSKDRDGAVLSFTRSEWAAFLAGAKDGEFALTD
jgi:hypothetical protein